MDRACIDCGAAVHSGPRCGSCGAKHRWAKSLIDNPLPLCLTCGSAITSRNRRKAKYCCHACRVADRASYTGRSLNRITKTCPACGREFAVAVSVAKRYNFCSRDCSASRGLDATCARCDGPFRHSQVQRRRYCCETCRRPPALVACAHCHEAFRVAPSTAGKRRYCSRRCYVSSGAETSIERIVRETLEASGVKFEVQVPIGPWVVDFLIDRLVIEADGDYWHARRPGADARKTADLLSRGLSVWRLSESHIVSPDFAVSLQQALGSL
jgi:very-short-patch-repair endonuclease